MQAHIDDDWERTRVLSLLLSSGSRAYRQICEGEEPWIALGNFRNAWYGYAKDRRVALVCDPLAKPTQDSELTHRWSALCAATVEFLCERYDVACPPWVHDPRYTLETPAAFAKRNIFCGNRLFANKYELAEHAGSLTFTVSSAPHTRS